MAVRPRLLTVVRDPFPVPEERPDPSELEELLELSIEQERTNAALCHPAGGPSNVVPLHPRRRRP